MTHVAMLGESWAFDGCSAASLCLQLQKWQGMPGRREVPIAGCGIRAGSVEMPKRGML